MVARREPQVTWGRNAQLDKHHESGNMHDRTTDAAQNGLQVDMGKELGSYELDPISAAPLEEQGALPMALRTRDSFREPCLMLR